MTGDTLVIRAASLAAALLLPGLAAAQTPPKTQPPIAPKAEQLDPNACAKPDEQTTVGKGSDADAPRSGGKDLSDKLAQSNGVICPPTQVDPEIKAPTPPGGAMQVIPPPGSPGGDQSVQPK